MNKRISLIVILTIFIISFSNASMQKTTGKITTDTQIEYAKSTIKQKAIDVAKQIEIYLKSNPTKTLKELQNDKYFQEIAVQKVGKTGYTAVTDYNTLIARFHKNPKIVNYNLSLLSKKLPDFWEIMSKTKGGKEAEGQYKWIDEDGKLRSKYMYIAIVNTKTADGVGLSVAATTYIDEIKPEKNLKFIQIYLILSLTIIIFIIITVLHSLRIIQIKKNHLTKIMIIPIISVILILIVHTYIITNQIEQKNNKEINEYTKLIEEHIKLSKDLNEENLLNKTIKIKEYYKKDTKNQIEQIWFSTVGIIFLIIIIGTLFYIILIKSLTKEIKEKTKEIEKINRTLEEIIEKRTKELVSLNKNLEKEVKKRTKELNEKITDLNKNKKAIINIMEDLKEANENLKKLDKAKSEFLNMVSHELKTPLTALIAYIELLDDSNENISKEEKEIINVIKRNANSLKMLIGNILEIARMQAGKFELTKEKTDLKELINNSLEEIKILAQQKNIKLKKEINKLPKINIDPEKIKEVINNLVSNAIKFTEKGSITIKAIKKENYIILSVEDTGVGIPKEHLDDLFKAFYQVDASISRKYGGTGLGLTITKKIIEAHNGKITVTSKENKGTKFTIYLPIK